MSTLPLWAVFGVGLLTGIVTLVGGTLVLRFSSALDLLVGFSSGAIIGVALFDLLPEALDLAATEHTALSVTTALAMGFALYLTLHRASVLIRKDSGHHRHFAPAALTLHSLLDGVGIGLAFHVSTAAGFIVAAGVLAHDAIDGANTVVASLSNGVRGSIARTWLAADSGAPLAGILLASTITIPASSLAILLAGFAGAFLYIGASELLPLSHDIRPRMSTVGTTAAGLALIYIAAWLASPRGN
jgi:zinc transporter ZupT